MSHAGLFYPTRFGSKQAQYDYALQPNNMPQELLIAVLAGLSGMLGWGFADLFAKKTIDEIGDITSLAWGHIFGTIALLISVLVKVLATGKNISVPTETSTWALLLFFGALQAVIYLLVYRGFAKGQVAVLNPVFASFSGITAFISILFFGEAIRHMQIVALGILFSGVLLLNIDIQALRVRRLNFIRVPGFAEVALATVLAAFWTLGWDKFINGHDWIVYALFMYAFMTLTILVYAKFKKIILLIHKPPVWKFLVLIGVCETIAYLGISYGYSTTSLTSVVAVLSGAFSLPTIIGARLFLHEKTTALQTIGSVIIILGIILLTLL